MRLIISCLLCLAFIGCSTTSSESSGEAATMFMPSAADYDAYLTGNEHPTLAKAEEAISFWSPRIKADSTGIGSFAKAAGGYTARFGATGDPADLRAAERLLRKGLAQSANDKAGFARQLAANLISQHRFAEAKQVLTDVEALGTQSIRQPAQDAVWFDVLMELGEYTDARQKLGNIRDLSDFGYLIREAKWQDYQGDLDEAISYLEQARGRAESSDNTSLRVWSYTNIGDFYGHAGRIEDAYNSYLAALELEPDNAYALKSLAYIQYAHAGDLQEANRIIDHVMDRRQVPDYYLIKAELADQAGNASAAEGYKQAFAKTAQAPAYGDMYNTYLIEEWVDSDPQRALSLAQREVERRDTPETRQLLALAQWKAGDTEAALATLEAYVIDKTSEPMALLHAAQIYKASSTQPERLKAYKAELSEASFEVGPATYAEVEAL